MRYLGLCSIAFATAVVLAGPSRATTIHGDFVGTTVTFVGVQETSNPGDPEPLFEAPTVIGNVLLFDPSAFTALSEDGGVVGTGSQLQFDIEGKTAFDYVDNITIQEFGDAAFGGVGTNATGGYISMAGYVTVLEANGSAILPVVIGFTGVITADGIFDLPTNPGTTLWTAEAFIDVGAYVPNATLVKVSLDNDLTVYSEAGTSAKIQKKIADGIVITVPEPVSLALLAVACLGLGLGLGRGRGWS